ncbi:MAG: DUF2510 domain-containing protein [Actinomycetota bacterium]|nr:DUF2510 domain-containing protein [Actinomycetota bacterium]
MIGAPGWYPDPSGRFEHRYHNGAEWTADVASDGRRFVDAGLRRAVDGPARRGGNGLATASMVCGIGATALGWIPFVAVPMVATAIVALGLGAAGLRRSRTTGTGRSFAVAGLITGGAGLGACAVGFVLTIAFVDAIRAYDRPSPHSAQLVSCRGEDEAVVAGGTITNDGTQTSTFAILVEVGRGRRRDERVIVDDLAPGATAPFAVTIPRSRFERGEPNCRIAAVNGPLPFGIDVGSLD